MYIVAYAFEASMEDDPEFSYMTAASVDIARAFAGGLRCGAGAYSGDASAVVFDSGSDAEEIASIVEEELWLDGDELSSAINKLIAIRDEVLGTPAKE